MTTLIIGVSVLVIYLAFCIIKDKQVPPSISETFYLAGKWMFTFVMFAEAILLSMSLIPMSPANWQWLAFVGSGALGFVGSAPYFKDKFEHSVHYAGAITFAVGTQAWVAIVASPWVLLTFIPAAILALIFRKQWLFIGEITCVINVIFGDLVLM